MATVGTGKFELTLNSENVGAWMSINNAFTYDWGKGTAAGHGRNSDNPDRYWTGVLVQLGRFRRIEDDELMTGFGQIQFKQDDTTVGILTQADFQKGNIVWVNIKKKGGRTEPVPLRAFRERFKLGEIRIRNGSFVRATPLHRFLQPYPGGITLWHEKGYNVSASINNQTPPHVSHTFTLDNPIELEILQLTQPAPTKEQHWEKVVRFDDTAPSWERLDGSTLEEQENGYSGDATVVGVNRITVTCPVEGGQQIGKNPPQTP